MKFFKREFRTKRVIRRFAIFPRIVDKETRWLEVVYIEQTYHEACYAEDYNSWKNNAFVTKEDYNIYKYITKKGIKR